MEILICTDGSNSSLASADLVSKLGFPATSKIIVLGVSENKTEVEKLNIAMDLIDKKLSGKYPLSRKIRYGNPFNEIMAEALEASYDLVAVGGGGGQLGLLHPKLGSTTSMLARKLHTHFLVARNIPEMIEKILVCASAEATASETMTLGGTWISNLSARVELLHVVPVIKDGEKNSPDQSSNEVKEAHDLVLERASQQLHQAGIKEVIPHIRRGLVVEEALMELSEGGYELLVVGAHYQPGQDRWKGTLFDDITDQLLNRSTCSVLII